MICSPCEIYLHGLLIGFNMHYKYKGRYGENILLILNYSPERLCNGFSKVSDV